jgi:myo-inositol-1(or 4)-monophosphatase
MNESHELATAKHLARVAAGIALSRAEGASPKEKANRSFVTEVDLELEAMIRAGLAKEFPNDLLTGEEMPASGARGRRHWSIDPIDGTGNFVWGLPLWAISIGLVDAGEPALGVIAIPPLDELYWAVRGEGAWRDGVRLSIQDAPAFHPQDNVCVGTNALRTLDARSLPGRLRDLGSACCEQSFVAAGRLQAAVFLGEAEHDLAAGALIAWEAGARLARLGGENVTLADYVAQTPVRVPTFVASPRRLDALLEKARLLP